VTDLGLSPEYFWGLTWYDWGLYVLKLHKDNQRRLSERELPIELTRSFMALFANANRKENARVFEPQDFYKLSTDKISVEERPLTFKEAKQMYGSRLKKNGDK
jgi:hypothetical protein